MVLSTPAQRQRATLRTTPGPGGCIGGGNVQVYVRCRPVLQEEKEEDQVSVLSFTQDTNQVRVNHGSGQVFQYTGVFEPASKQEEVFSHAVAPLLKKVQEGGHCTVLACGHTGSGKSHTIGTHPGGVREEEGILQRAIRTLLRLNEPGISLDGSLDDGQTQQRRSHDHLTISMLEVYNETVYDLLTPTRKTVSSKNAFGGGLEVMGAVKKEVQCVEEGMAVLEKGTLSRSTTSTSENQHSSRSHAVISLTLPSIRGGGLLKLVDLAGSECAGRVGSSSTTTFNEGISINKSLLTLGKVLNALTAPTPIYVPYRECVLTRLLKDSLCGSGQTVMVACVTPASASLGQTLTTLRYAQQATHIKLRPLPPPPSTIKKPVFKRGREDDVTATPGAWKKRRRHRGVAKHNTTISTPGHRPPPPGSRLLTPLNTTLASATPSTSDVTRKSPHNNKMEDQLLMPPPPVFEDDSPSTHSCVFPINNSQAHVSSFSPLIKRVTNQLEQTVLSQLEGIEERITESFLTKFTKKGSDVTRKSPHNNKMEDQLLMPPPPPPPVFEDNSPSTHSCVFPINNTQADVSSFSPLMKQVTNQLEQTVLSQLEGIEERITESFLTKFTKKGRPKEKATAAASWRYPTRSSTPTDKELSEHSAEHTDNKNARRRSVRIQARKENESQGSIPGNASSEEDDLLGNSLVTALFSQRKMRHKLKEIMTEVLKSDSPLLHSKVIKAVDNKTSSRSMADISNNQVDKASYTQTMKKRPETHTHTSPSRPRSEAPEDSTWANVGGHNFPHTSTAILEDRIVRKSAAGVNTYDLPLTSTAICQGRAVRRSTRLSTKLSFHTALANNLSPCESMTSFMSHESGNVTVLNNNKSPSSALTSTFLENTTIYSVTCDGSPPLRPFMEKKPSAKLDMTKMETRGYINALEAVGGGVKEELNTDDAELMMVACALPTSKKINSTAVLNATTLSASQLDSNTTHSLLEETLQTTEKHDINKRQRSRRVSALNATLLNHQILHNESPVLRPRKRTIANRNQTTGRQAMKNKTQIEEGWVEKPQQEMMMIKSPTAREQHNQKILDILNTGDLRTLQKLVTVGPKTAILIHQYREFNGRFERVKELEKVHGLYKSSYIRFMKANMLDM
ncbi:hypothetical protein Pcinc_022763 [Petrolisthes cinctipes]|uniref:Kinesin motor domain-containing protein n=1 Tax=Petrolisthes cinctipes TaxID=88211 RepID=A0AAE1FH41_PETCI|nr:hypothetical protein Pcinc_022763 [Petrolisthes cinctipes]